ncbi:MAG: ABC transporter ATP-binding protein [Gammaproteobacteria bacterium]
MASVAFQQVSKRFAEALALSQLNLQIDDGEFVVLVGPSGCGKTTALRLLAGLEEVTDGEILIDGKRVNTLSPQQRNVAMVFQNYALYPHMDVQANLAFPLRMAGMPTQTIATRVKEIAELLDLSALLARKPKQLSGGQRQRVAMGRALVRDPSVFLLDEPLSNLDAQLRAQIRADIARLQRRLQKTTLYVTHDQVEAMTLGDRVAVMHAGQLQQVATPEILYQQPANTFVARFIGSPGMNIIPATSLKQFESQASYLGIRPEAISTRHEKHYLAIKVRIQSVEYIGHESLAYVTLFAMHDAEAGHVMIARIAGKFTASRDAESVLYVDPADVYLFDQSGQRIESSR